MKKAISMKGLVVVWGVLAAIALALPGLVAIGIFFIVPGLILAAAPTVFVYLSAAYLVRMALPLQPGRMATLASLALALLLGWIVNQPGRWYENRQFEAAQLPEVVPVDPLTLDGDVSLEWDSRSRRITRPEACEHICAALLDIPGVESATIGPEDMRRRLSLMNTAAPEAGVHPQNPGEILDVFIRVDPTQNAANDGLSGVERFERNRDRRDALNAAWTMRLGGAETIAEEAPPPAGTPDWTIRHTIQPSRDEPRIDRLEIFDGTGDVRLRKSLVRHTVPSLFFHIAFDGPLENPGFKLGSSGISTGERYAEFDADAELLRHVEIEQPQVPENAQEVLRTAAAAVLDDPAATPKQLALVQEWLGQMDRKPEREEHIALIRRVAEDPRMRDVAPVLRSLYEHSAPVEFRRAFTARILVPESSPEDREYYARMLARMPVGTFAQPTAEELAIWGDPVLRREAAPFVERLADRGEEGLEPLLAALREAVALEKWHERRPIVREIRRGLARLGTTAAPALPYVTDLVAQPRSPVLQSGGEGLEWRKTLLLMGLQASDLPFSENLNAERRARERERIQKAVAEYDPDKRSGYNY